MNDQNKNRKSEVLANENLQEYKTFPLSDYVVCEYHMNDGSLAFADGQLLSRFGAKIPENIYELEKTVASWPTEKEYSNKFAQLIKKIIADTDEGKWKTFPDVEMLLQKGKNKCWVNISVVKLTHNEHNVVSMYFSNISEKKERLLSLMDDAENDYLTKTMNRRSLSAIVDKLAKNGGTHAYIMMDLDRFKKVNDTYGHLEGDKILVETVKKLRKGLRGGDVIGRIGGDEFMVCLKDIKDDSAIERVAKHICTLARQTMPNDLYISASLGVAVSPRDGTSFDELYDKADKAMYKAKRNGGDGFVVYSDALDYDGAEGKAESSAEEAEAELISLESNALVTYNKKRKSFVYPARIEEIAYVKLDSRPIWDIFEQDGVASRETSRKIKHVIEGLAGIKDDKVIFKEYFLKNNDGLWRWFRFGFIIRKADPEKLLITITDANDEILSKRQLRQISEYDELTGLLTRNAFIRKLDSIIKENRDAAVNGEHAVIFFDILRFKAINDVFGSAEGDRLLIYIADILNSFIKSNEAAARLSSDRFAMIINNKNGKIDAFINSYQDAVSSYELPFEIVSNVGVYVINDAELTGEAILDRAILAQSTIKGSYIEKSVCYDEAMRNDMLGEQEIAGIMATALADEQFVVYYQPQYNHATGKMISAEALVRWQHPERGLLSPGVFIPIFEKNGFITNLDFYVFEQVCKFIRSGLDKGLEMVPISVNLTRYDIFHNNFIEIIEGIRNKYNVPVKFIRIEITESTVVGSNQYIADIIDKLHQCGYIIEMDDFGCGYSSLTMLKDINLDILKLDMCLLSDNMDNKKGGTILSSIIRMAKWLDLPVIAEGIEHISQADYLNSIGCNYIQGYLYARPMASDDFVNLIKKSETEETCTQLNFVKTMDAASFWDPDSMETLIFSHYVGAADIFCYNSGKIEMLRVNKKYLKEISGAVPASSLTEKEIIESDVLSAFDAENRKIYLDAIEQAIKSSEEVECEAWRRYSSCDCDLRCIRSTLHVIGNSSDGSYLIYESIRDITAEKNTVTEIIQRENIFRQASEQINVYYWEYDVKAKTMKPCFRCVRDLGLPELCENHPEPAIELGIFPPEVADIYRDMHKKIEQGVEFQEIDMPLTPARVMFRVRYTTHFDEDGKPVKAYGSAVPI